MFKKYVKDLEKPKRLAQPRPIRQDILEGTFNYGIAYNSSLSIMRRSMLRG
jgi:hypothetical protein